MRFIALLPHGRRFQAACGRQGVVSVLHQNQQFFVVFFGFGVFVAQLGDVFHAVDDGGVVAAAEGFADGGQAQAG